MKAGPAYEEEAALIRRIVEGETAAFRVLVDRYKDVCFTVACGILKNENDAQDVLQDAFVKAFRHLRKFQFQSSFSTWLHRIVVNTCYKALERRKNRKTTPLDPAVPATPAATGTFEQLKASERSAYIHTILDHMKPTEALLLRLYYLSEHSTPEIADITGLSPGNVKVILHRARKDFSDRLAALLGPEKDQLL